MSEKIIVKLRRDNISVSSCKEGVYLTFASANEARKSNVKQCTNKPLIKSNKHLLMND